MLTALRVAKQGAAPLARSFSTTVSSAKNFKFDLTTPYESHKIDAPSLKVSATGEELIKYFEDMYMIRKFETAADRLYKSRKIRGFLHLYNGQEAIAVGIEAAITKKDHIITAYRDHGYAFTRGDTPHRILAELLGKRTGCSEGKGGSMHMYSSANRFWGGNGIVGAQCPIGAGIAFASKYRGDKEVCLALYGDGAANQGQLFEAFNMAALWKLPVIFVCENNKYGMGTSINRAAATPNFFSRGDFVPGLRIDGMDVLSVKNGVKYAADYSRENGPIVLEMVTYRYVGHSMSDPGTTYRTREEIDRIRASSDPIEGARKRIIDNKIETAEEITVREKRITAIVDEALAQAEADPFPDPATDLWKDVYAEDTFIRGTDLHSSHYPA